MAVDFNLPTVDTNYTAFPTQIIENIDAALQQLSVGSPSNVPTNAIKWDATANRWKKYNGSAYVDLTTNYDLNANLDVTQLTLGDSEKIRLGAGQDLQIFHDQTLGHSFIKDTGTGNLKICGSTIDIVNAANTALLLKASQGSGGTTSLYQNGNERLKTLSTGVEIFGTSLDLGDNVSLNLGTNDDFKLVHNDTDGTIENTKGILNIKKSDGSGGSQNGIVLEANSDISLYQSTGANGDPQLKVNANGIFLRGQQLGTSLNNEVIIFDNIVKANTNNNIFQIKHVRDSATDATWQGSATRLQMRVDSTNQGYIQFNGADNNYGMELGTYMNQHTLDKFAFFVRGGKAELYFDGSPKLTTGQYGVDVTGSLSASNIDLGDNAKLLLGANDSFQIYHSGANSIINENGTGNLYIASTAGEIQLAKGGTFAHMVRAVVDAQVELYHVGNKVFTTTADGIVTSTNSGEGSITIKGGEGGSSALIFHADEGDNNNDKYRWIATDNEALFLQNFASGGWENNIKAVPEGGAFLYWDNTPKLETTTGGVHITGTIGLTNELDFTGNTNKFVDFETIDNNKYVEFRHFNLTGTFEKFIRADANGTTELFHNGNKKIETSEAGAKFTGDDFAFQNPSATFTPGGNPAGKNVFIAIGDSDTGIAQDGDGQLEIWADNQEIANFNATNGITTTKNISANSFTGDGSGLTNLPVSGTPAVEVATLSSNQTITSSSYSNILTLTIDPSTSGTSLLVTLGGTGVGVVDSDNDPMDVLVRIRRGSTTISETLSTNISSSLSGTAFVPISLSLNIKDTNAHGGNAVTYSVQAKKSGSGFDDPKILKGTNLVVREIL